jgi:hypothetical protein
VEAAKQKFRVLFTRAADLGRLPERTFALDIDEPGGTEMRLGKHHPDNGGNDQRVPWNEQQEKKIRHAQEHRPEEKDRVERFADDELIVLDRKHALPFDSESARL